MGKLSGIKVIDLSVFFPGPMLTMMLADQGAEVWKVEAPNGGDPTRDAAPFETGQSTWFRNLNRGKKSIMLDLKNEADKARLWDMIADADIFVEGFRPGVMARLGFDYAAVSARNPGIVYCSISAFGQTGSRAHHPAHDMAVQALSGFLSVNDGSDGTPVVPGVPAADLAGGLTGLSAILMALIGRQASGRGDYIDCAMFDSLLPWSAHIVGEALFGGPPPVSAQQRSLGGAGLYQVYQTSDGKHICLAGREVKFARVLLSALGRDDLLPMAVAEAGQQGALIAFLRDIFATRSRDAWTEWFHDKDVAFAPVLNFAEALADPALHERGLLVELDGAHMIGPAIRFAGESWTPHSAPDLNADG